MQGTADILFQYLKDILYNPEKASLKIEALPPEFRKLGEGMMFMEHCVQESRSFSKAMARGDLSQELPGADNVLAAPMKELQNSLRHLAWQTQQVARGDYSQTVDFMGEFSEAFNTMIHQLSERQESLVTEKKLVEEKNLELEHSLELVMALTNYTHNLIFVYSMADHELLFSNDTSRWFCKTRPVLAEKIQDIIRQKEADAFSESPFWEMEIELDIGTRKREYFAAESYSFSWRGQTAMVHILVDDTERKNKENMMYKLAYIDPLTGLNNRRYAMDRMEKMIAEKVPFCMSYIDIDNLKYCNDNFGHKSGDEYLISVANALKSLSGDVCRIGGDEFILIQKGSSEEEQNKKLEDLRRMIQENQVSVSYPRSFSYASCHVPSGPEQGLGEFIRLADTRMYQYKAKHKGVKL